MKKTLIVLLACFILLCGCSKSKEAVIKKYSVDELTSTYGECNYKLTHSGGKNTSYIYEHLKFDGYDCAMSCNYAGEEIKSISLTFASNSSEFVYNENFTPQEITSLYYELVSSISKKYGTPVIEDSEVYVNKNTLDSNVTQWHSDIIQCQLSLNYDDNEKPISLYCVYSL